MSHDLARLVAIRELREKRAERELRSEREALRLAQAEVESDRDALQDIERKARAQQADLCEGRRLAGDAFAALDFVAAQHLQAKQVRLRMHRSSAEAAVVSQRVEVAHAVWRNKARSYEALKSQEETRRERSHRQILARSEEAVAEEHGDAWGARMVVAAREGHAP